MIKYYYAEGATPLDLNEIAGLIPTHITTQAELNEWEQQNILDAELWAFSQEHPTLLTIDFIRKLHKKMFAKTWQWAGVFRKSCKNVGIDSSFITTGLKNLLDDVTAQLQYSSYSFDEIAYRFHHRLVFIHPFANGNGRHARIMTDLLLVQFGQNRFTWGRASKLPLTNVRKNYIEALKKADQQDYGELAKFVRG